MTAFKFRMPVGIVGSLTRGTQEKTVEGLPGNGSAPFAAFGLPGKIVANAFVPVTGAADAVLGFLVRTYPTTPAVPNEALGTATPICNAQTILSILRSGYMMVKNNAGTPVAGGAVYYRYANGAAQTPVGGLEAAAVGGSTVAIPLAFFKGPADANGIVEIEFNV